MPIWQAAIVPRWWYWPICQKNIPIFLTPSLTGIGVGLGGGKGSGGSKGGPRIAAGWTPRQRASLPTSRPTYRLPFRRASLPRCLRCNVFGRSSWQWSEVAGGHRATDGAGLARWHRGTSAGLCCVHKGRCTLATISWVEWHGLADHTYSQWFR